jgi:tetratricopeptide (TPR) repeat protein
MKNLKFTFIFLLISLCSCGQKLIKHKVDPAVVKLNDSAMALVRFVNIDSTKKAIFFLDRATAIDSNYFMAYWNKLSLQSELKQYDKAILTVSNLIRLKPDEHEIYLIGGTLYEKMGDTISSKIYFQKSLTICTNVLDTMNIKNKDYNMLFMDEAINLIMLSNQTKGNQFLKQLYDRQTDSFFKELTATYMNKNKKEVLDLMSGDKHTDILLTR